jgi:hypothetical protein
MSNERKKELREIAKGMLPDPIISLAYVEHQIDLLNSLVLDLVTIVDQTKITTEMQDKINNLIETMRYSSIDFDNLSSPFENYKIPSMIELKQHTRGVQKRYLKKQMEENLL